MDQDDLEQFIEDELSNQTGYCHFGWKAYKIEEMKKDFIQKQKEKIQKIRENSGCENSRENAIKKLNLMQDDLETNGEEITKENIHLYYELMSNDAISKHRNILHTFFNTRLPLNIEDFLEIDREVINDNWKYECFSDGKVKKQSYFDVKDTLKPIEQYIAEIKYSNAYKSYIAKN